MAAKTLSLLERLRAKKQAKARTLSGVVWYANEEEWTKVKAFAVDPESFESTYEEWIDMVEESLQRFTLSGMQFRKVFVSAEELSAWCKQHNKPNNGQARARYVSEIMHKIGDDYLALPPMI